MPSFTDPFAETKFETISVGSKEVDSKVAVCVKDDDGEFQVAGWVSTGYNLIDNKRVDEIGTDIMSRSGHEWKPLKTLWDGKKFARYFITKESITEIESDNPELPARPLHLGLMMRNAYDGKGAFGEELFVCDHSCMNQFISRNRFGFFIINHDDKSEYMIEDAVKNLSSGMQKLIDVAPVFREMSQAPLSANHIIQARKGTMLPESMWGKVLLRLSIESCTMFGLYSAMTYIASHQLKGFNQLSIGNTITDHFLG